MGAVAQLQSSVLIFATFCLNSSRYAPHTHGYFFLFFFLEQPDEYQPPSLSRTRRGGRGHGSGERYGGGGQQSHSTGQNGGGRQVGGWGHPLNATEQDIVDDAGARVSAWLCRSHGWDDQPREQHLL